MANFLGHWLRSRCFLPVLALLLFCIIPIPGYVLPQISHILETPRVARDTILLGDSLSFNTSYTPEKRGYLRTRAPGPQDLKSVADFQDDIGDFGNVPSGVSLFYSGLTGSGPRQSRGWYNCHLKDLDENPFLEGGPTKQSAVTFDNILPPGYFQAENARLDGLFFNGQVKGSNGEIINTRDTNAKRASQAFAQAAENIVYFFTPTGRDGRNFPITTAWGGWEFPALTRNGFVELIVQVDPDLDLFDENNVLIPQIIWRASEGPVGNPPRGDLCSYGFGDDITFAPC